MALRLKASHLRVVDSVAPGSGSRRRRCQDQSSSAALGRRSASCLEPSTDIPAVGLGGFAISAALHKAGITGDQVEYVIMGQVIQAGTGQITARQAAAKGGIPMTVPAITLNKVCLSGLNAIALADQLIGYGEFEVVVAGGMESMTQGPYLLPGARSGYRYGDASLVDATLHDALFCAFDQLLDGHRHRVLQQGQGNHSYRAG